METLSDKIQGNMFRACDVKEFIKKLKEQLDIDYGESKGNKEFMLGLHHAKEIIDDLAGDKFK